MQFKCTKSWPDVAGKGIIGLMINTKIKIKVQCMLEI